MTVEVLKETVALVAQNKLKISTFLRVDIFLLIRNKYALKIIIINVLTNTLPLSYTIICAM